MEIVMKVFAVIFDVVVVIAVFYILFIFGIRVYWRLKSKKMVGAEIPVPEPSFQRLRKGKGIIYFTSPKCRPCKLVDPVFKKLSKEMKGITFIKVDVLKDPDKARLFGILATPSMILTENGRIREVLMGPVSERDLREKLS